VLNHGIVIFVGYRIALAVIVTALLLTGSIGAT
jgi:hypothetical protein